MEAKHNPEIIEDDEDWTFNGSSTREYSHVYHDYPARMIPQIARKLLRLYGAGSKTLFDPYCGTGSSLVEGLIYGLDVVGTDINPLARLIAEAKTDYSLANIEQEKGSNAIIRRLEINICSHLHQSQLLPHLKISLNMPAPQKLRRGL